MRRPMLKVGYCALRVLEGETPGDVRRRCVFIVHTTSHVPKGVAHAFFVWQRVSMPAGEAGRARDA